MTDPRPNPTTMEGMIWNANHVLEQALSPNVNGMPKALFKDCVGIAIASSVQLGCLLAGTTGTGVVFKKTDSGWSPPCAVGLSGLGFGLLLGMSVKDLIIFIYDETTLSSVAADHGAKFGSQYELTVGPFGRAFSSTFTASKKGTGAVFAVAYAKGAFGGISIEGAKLGAREFVNNKFYNAPTKAHDILFKEGSVTVSDSKVTMINEVYDKIDKLMQGVTAEPDAAEQAKKQAAKEAADKEHETVKDSPEVVEVDAAAEAAKEASS